MQKMMDRALERYGMEAIIQNAEGEQAVKVFFYSVNSASRQNMERVFFPLGEAPGGQYICVLPADARVEPEDALLLDGRAYLVRKVERMDLFSGPMYHWALCVEKGCEDTWGTNA